ncbi:hypothetical protein HI914_00704 [Erysiphe necator]|nr:hypothetical protein HI914_00704 [Erysiphe necator]
MRSAMFLKNYLVNITINPRRLLVISLLVSTCVQGQKDVDSKCKNLGPNSNSVCESQTMLFAFEDDKSNSNTTKIDEKDVTANDLDERNNNGNCSSVGVIYARGLSEPGNLGILTGPPFFDAIDNKVENEDVAIQGVNYPDSKPSDEVEGSPEAVKGSYYH